MTDTLNGTPQNFAGVVTAPSSAIHESIKRQTAELLKGVPDGKTMAVVSVHTQAGVNLALAHKFNEHFEVVGWIGKSGWDKPLLSRPAGGVSLAFAR